MRQDISDRRYRLGVDIGGTFTDLLLVDLEARETHIGKALTTPREPAVGVLNGLARLVRQSGIDPAGIANVIHATTLVTNAIIERKGARTGLITTQGMRDLLEIGREQKYELYDIFLAMPEPLVPPPLRQEAVERIYVGGEVLVPLDRERLEATIEQLARAGVESIAVCLLHSYANPIHEMAIEEEIHRLHPEILVSISARVAREVREYERTSTTVANAYVQPLTERYLARLQGDLAARGVQGELHIMLSSGGISSVDAAKACPVKLIESGPAAGALVGAFYGELLGEDRVLAFDMGGTTAKACLVEKGQPRVTYSFEVARVHRFKRGSGLPIRAPAVELIEIGAGGGSIAHVDDLGLLKVGPESAGAEPGPACYGLGGAQATVTDADLVLGYLNPDYFLGGEMALDLPAAEGAIRRVAESLGLDLTTAAWGIHNTVNENMASAARIHIAEKGHDPRRFTLLATGGAGPVHAFRVAQKIGISRIVCPAGAGVASSLGLLVAPPRMDFVHAYVTLLDRIDWPLLNSIYQKMSEQAAEELARAGVPREQIRWVRQADMRYVNQGHEVVVPVPDRPLREGDQAMLRDNFREAYLKLFNRYEKDVPVEVLNWRLSAFGPKPGTGFVEREDLTPPTPLPGAGRGEREDLTPPAPLPGAGRGEMLTSGSPPFPRGEGGPGGLGPSALKGTRRVYLPEAGGYQEVDVYDRYALKPGDSFAGPAVVEERESTVVVGTGALCLVDRFRNLVIEISE